MDELEKVKMLQDDLERLSAQLAQQQHTITQLQKQVQDLLPPGKQQPASTAVTQANTGTISNPGPSKNASLENLIGLGLIHLIGIIVLVIGLSLGVKYAIDANLISEKMRILLAYLAGALLLAFSFRLKKDFPAFSAILFSGAMASVYFTTYAAFVYYALFSFMATYIMMVLFTVYTTVEAIRYNRQEIALLGMVGAYGIPFLISPNRGNPDLLFLYMTIINSGVVALSIRKTWTLMGRLAQGITWVIFLAWLLMQERITDKDTGTLFMCLFFLLFFTNAVAPRLFRNEALPTPTTYQLLTNNLALSVAAFSIYNYSFENSTMAAIALFLSLFVAAQALLFVYWKEDRTHNVLAWYALSLFMLFIGFQWTGIVVTLLWLLTALVIFIIGAGQKSNPLRMTGITLMGVTLLKLVVLDSLTFSTVQKVIAYLVLGVLLLLISFFYQKYKQQLFGE